MPEDGFPRLNRCNDGGREDTFGGQDDPVAVRANVPGICTLGTDCDDCGVRIYCVSCSPECQLHNNNYPWTRAGETGSPCLEEMYGNGRCDQACNSDRCGYDGGDCSIEEKAANCLEYRQQIGEDFSGPPVENYPLTMDIRLHPRIAQTDTYAGGRMVFEFELTYTIQYSDPRLRSSACGGAIVASNSILSATKNEIKDDQTAKTIKLRRAAYYVASLVVMDSEDAEAVDLNAVDDLLPVVYQWKEAMHWLGSRTNSSVSPENRSSLAGDSLGSDDNSSLCLECATVRTDHRRIRLHEGMSFTFFPFDYQTFHFSLSVPSANLAALCSSLETSLLSEKDWDDYMRDWGLRSNSRGTVRTTLQSFDTCNIEIPVARRTMKYLVLHLSGMIIVVWGACFSGLF